MTSNYNEKKTYKCEACGEWFRLKVSLLNHDCKEDKKRRRRNE